MKPRQNTITSKSDLRQQMRERLRNVKPAERMTGSRRIAECILTQPWFAEADVVGVYCALRSELSLEAVMEAAWSDRKKVAVPVRTCGDSAYHWSLIFPETEWEQGPDGVSQPTLRAALPPEALTVVFVPGLAFTKNGVRLGRGGGYYDRLLAGVRGIKAGVAFDWQVLEQLPVEPHDIRMDLIVTDKTIYDALWNKEDR